MVFKAANSELVSFENHCSIGNYVEAARSSNFESICSNLMILIAQTFVSCLCSIAAGAVCSGFEAESSIAGAVNLKLATD